MLDRARAPKESWPNSYLHRHPDLLVDHSEAWLFRAQAINGTLELRLA